MLPAKKIKSQRGTETIEFVIFLPIMLFLVFGSMSYMFAIYAKIVVVDAAREGARAEALGTGTAEEKVKQVLKGYNLSDESSLVNVTVTVENQDGTDYVSAKVIYKQSSIFPGLPQLIGNSPWPSYFNISSVAIFKKEKL